MPLGNGPDGHPLPVAQAIYRLLGDLLREWNDPAGAERLLIEAATIAERHRLVAALPMTYSLLAQARQVRGDTEHALVTVRRALDQARAHNLTRDERILAAKVAEMQLRQGDLEAAVHWADAYTPSSDARERLGRPRESDVPLTYARVRIAQGQPNAALARLEQLRSAAEQIGHIDHLIEILTLQSIAYSAGGHLARADDALARALTLAEPGGYVRVFLDEGAPMAALLARGAERSVQNDTIKVYIERLLGAFPESDKGIGRQGDEESGWVSVSPVSRSPCLPAPSLWRSR